MPLAIHTHSGHCPFHESTIQHPTHSSPRQPMVVGWSPSLSGVECLTIAVGFRVGGACGIVVSRDRAEARNTQARPLRCAQAPTMPVNDRPESQAGGQLPYAMVCRIVEGSSVPCKSSPPPHPPTTPKGSKLRGRRATGRATRNWRPQASGGRDVAWAAIAGGPPADECTALDVCRPARHTADHISEQRTTQTRNRPLSPGGAPPRRPRFQLQRGRGSGSESAGTKTHKRPLVSAQTKPQPPGQHESRLGDENAHTPEPCRPWSKRRIWRAPRGPDARRRPFLHERFYSVIVKMPVFPHCGARWSHHRVVR